MYGYGRTTGRFVVGAALVGLLSGCGGGGGSGTPTEPPVSGPQVVTVEVHDDFFEPRSVVVDPGTTVRWVMRGTNEGHTVTALDEAFDSGFVFTNAGSTFERHFPASEEGQTLEYSCVTHSVCCDMKGSIRVGASAPPPRPGY